MATFRIKRIILIIISVLILIGVTLVGRMLATDNERSVITVTLDKGEQETVEFKYLGLIPGESCEYTLKLNNNKADAYSLKLDFVDVDEEMTLKNFAFIKIEAGDGTVCDLLLADVFTIEAMTLPVDFEKELNTELKITYYLPIEVGNEAKGAEAIFELVLTASNE